MEHIVIGICTFNREACLKTLLLSIAELSVPENVIISVLVVNNNMADVEELSDLIATLSMPFSLKLVHESTVGIASARNRALSEALILGADALAFTDDDCIVPTHWFISLYRAYIKYGRYMVTGPRHYIFPLTPRKLSALLIQESKMLLAVDTQNGSHVTIAATNNVLFNLALVQQHNLWFDLDFNQCGGEDTMFFISLYEKTKLPGVFIKDAYVYETLHNNRISIRWVLTRYLSQGFLLAQFSQKMPHAIHVQNVTMKKAPIKFGLKILKCCLRAITVLGGIGLDVAGFIIKYGAFFLARLSNKKYDIYSIKIYK